MGPGELIVTRRLGKEGATAATSTTRRSLWRSMARRGRTALVRRPARVPEAARPALPARLSWTSGRGRCARAGGDCREAYEKAREGGRLLEESHGLASRGYARSICCAFRSPNWREAGLSVDERGELQAEQRLLARAEDILRDLRPSQRELLKRRRSATDAATLVAQAAAAWPVCRRGSRAGLPWRRRCADVPVPDVTELARELHSYVDTVSASTPRGCRQSTSACASTPTWPASTAVRPRRRSRIWPRPPPAGGARAGRRRPSRLEGGARRARLRGAGTGWLCSPTAPRQAAPLLEEAVAAQLAGLGMPSAVMSVALETRSGWEGLRETGADTVEFLLAANPGQPPGAWPAPRPAGSCPECCLASSARWRGRAATRHWCSTRSMRASEAGRRSRCATSCASSPAGRR